VSVVVAVGYALFISWWCIVLLFIYSIPAQSPQPGQLTLQIPTADPEKFKQGIRNIILFQVFGFFWVTAWISGASKMVVAGGVSSWYFSRSTGARESLSPTTTSLWLACTKSMGTIAYGSLILAVVRFINYLLNQLRKANEQSGGNKLVGFLITCVMCCVGCVERIIKYVTKYAYIYVAIYGEDFCSSAKNVHNLMSRNAFTLVMADMITGWVLLIGKLFGVGICVMVTAALGGGHVSSLSLVIVAVGSGVIFHLYSIVIHMALDTVFVCYLEDLERNRDSKRYFMSPATHDSLQAARAERNV